MGFDEAMRVLSSRRRDDHSEEGESDQEQDSSSLSIETDAQDEDVRLAGVAGSMVGCEVEVDGFPASRAMYRHVMSGILHLARDEYPDCEGELTVFVCGKTASANYVRERAPTLVLTAESALGAGPLRTSEFERTT